MPNIVQKRLRQARQKANLSLNETANLLNKRNFTVTPQALQYMETQNKWFHYEILTYLADIYNVKVGYFYGEDEINLQNKE